MDQEEQLAALRETVLDLAGDVLPWRPVWLWAGTHMAARYGISGSSGWRTTSTNTWRRLPSCPPPC